MIYDQCCKKIRNSDNEVISVKLLEFLYVEQNHVMLYMNSNDSIPKFSTEKSSNEASKYNGIR